MSDIVCRALNRGLGHFTEYNGPFHLAIPFNIAPPPLLRCLDILWGEGVSTLNFPRGYIA